MPSSAGAPERYGCSGGAEPYERREDKRLRPPVRECGRNHFVFSRYKTEGRCDNRGWVGAARLVPGSLRLLGAGLQ
ncbi:hypothetical protein HEK616_11440 [Streptomyces nigrescens]|uniref:Uncharacterized protein n=1 Tax=Streptomyces nigrescens TaxID=1920 RepID=A0ABN6QN74_STRNI|nr:hypothetical protein HEK616_11440 [Streptomyces nigrescens]